MEDVLAEVNRVLGDDSVVVTLDTPIIGEDGVMDSMSLVELCLRLEDIATELGFEFDWTSEKAMSLDRSMFRTVRTLAEEFDRQRTEKA